MIEKTKNLINQNFFKFREKFTKNYLNNNMKLLEISSFFA